MPHIHEKIDHVSELLIVNGDGVLLRMHDKYDMWLPPGGHVELDEDFVEAALREAKEETGLDVELFTDAYKKVDTGERDIFGEWELPIPRFINRHRINETHEHISFVYFGTSNNRDINPAEGEKRDGFKWFTKSELEDPACEVNVSVKKYALAALDTVSREV